MNKVFSCFFRIYVFFLSELFEVRGRVRKIGVKASMSPRGIKEGRDFLSICKYLFIDSFI